ncbi:hypothetical protein C8Q76DRAFT_626778 [Earliella scabrosa]|nr:hypothetical protein C8Q76DRAFT_626778 [Earliella scabrosa]
MIYDYFHQSFQTALHPISTLEHYWTLRAARAELLLSAREGHKRELTAVYTSHEDRRSREITELNDRYAREYAHVTRMMWMVLIVLAMLIGLVAFLLIRYVPPAVATPASRRPGSVHFTIPVLSPFTSVIEHETSAVNVQLVAILLLAAGITLFVWLKCCTMRR